MKLSELIKMLSKQHVTRRSRETNKTVIFTHKDACILEPAKA